MFKLNSRRGFYCLLALGLVSFGCTQKKAPSEAANQSEVNLAIWSNYLSPELVTQFEKRTGIHVQLSHYSSNEELLAKMQAGATGYDVVLPTDYMVYAMVQLGLVRELEFQSLPHAKSIDPKFLNKTYDPGNKFSVPYDWGTTGIAVNRSLYKGSVKSWKDLYEKEELAGRFSLLDDPREVIGSALKALGYSLNSKNPEEIKKAKELLFRARKRVKAFTSEPLMALVNGETAVAQAYMSDALQARRATHGKIDYVLPEEGGTLWIDLFVIPKQAPHPKAAHALIDFLLEGHSGLTTVQSVFVATANQDTFKMLPGDLRNNLMLFPPAAVMAKLEMLEDIGHALPAWDRAWTEIKAHTHD